MKKKLLSSAILLGIIVNPISFSFAKSELVEGRAYDMALQYIDNSLSDEAWKDNNPVISKETKFYTDDEKQISYIEYKISCDSTPDCGFIMMNVDGNDVAVPIASPTGITPSEMTRQGDEQEMKNYYFSPFDIYSENTLTGEVLALDPKYAIKEEKGDIKEQKQALKNQLKEAKASAKEFKKSDKFKELKEEIKDQILTVPKQEFSFNMLDMSYAATYTSPGASNVFVPGGQSSSSCIGATPCYNQFSTTYYGESCLSGCLPTAFGIIYGYHDRNGYPGLISGTAPMTNSYAVNQMIKTIGIDTQTKCNSNSTKNEAITSTILAYRGEIYAQNHGYPNANANLDTFFTTNAQIFSKTKSEINSFRPVIINTDSHSMVGFGYKSTGTSKIVRMNMGWGGTAQTSGYNWSNIDQNLDSIYYYNSNTGLYYHDTKSIITVNLN